VGAAATNPAAVARDFAVKGRPADHPLIVHLVAADELRRWAADVPPAAARLAAALWPGPLTLVLPRAPALPAAAAGGRDSVGLRVPDHPLATRLLEAAGVPVAAPSANRFGRVSPTTAADVRADLGDDVDMVLDGGPCRVGVESTIVEVLDGPPTLLRAGGVPVELIEEVLGGPLRRLAGGPARASGMLPSHYAPGCRVELVAAEHLARRAAAGLRQGLRVAVLAPDVALTPVGGPPGDGAERTPSAAGSTAARAPSRPQVPGLRRQVALPDGVVVLDTVVSVEEYARTLYRRLRDADEAGADVLLAVPPPPSGLGLAIADRLRRAAAPRP
jgi:L-threonylcarbamoyladenylate synthase